MLDNKQTLQTTIEFIHGGNHIHVTNVKKNICPNINSDGAQTKPQSKNDHLQLTCDICEKSFT